MGKLIEFGEVKPLGVVLPGAGVKELLLPGYRVINYKNMPPAEFMLWDIFACGKTHMAAYIMQFLKNS